MAEAPMALEMQAVPTEAKFEAEFRLGPNPCLHIRSGGVEALAFGLSLVWNGEDLLAHSVVTEVSNHPVVEEFDLLCGKAATRHRAEHLERTFTLSHPEAGQWQLIIREAADGAAFRYRVPAAEGELGRAGGRVVIAEGTRVWFQEYQTWYENHLQGRWAGEIADQDLGLPVLLQTADHHLLITDAPIDVKRLTIVVCGRAPRGLQAW